MSMSKTCVVGLDRTAHAPAPSRNRSLAPTGDTIDLLALCCLRVATHRRQTSQCQVGLRAPYRVLWTLRTVWTYTERRRLHTCHSWKVIRAGNMLWFPSSLQVFDGFRGPRGLEKLGETCRKKNPPILVPVLAHGAELWAKNLIRHISDVIPRDTVYPVAL